MMDLFNTDPNILPYDGIADYHGKIFTAAEADRYYETLFHTIEWKNDEAVIFGKHFVTPRKVAWYGDHAFSYTYSGTTKEALPWTNELLELKKIVEEKTQHSYNSCLLNLYHNGDEGMAWHSDDEKTLGGVTVIGSLSFGAERKFAFKHKRNKDVVSVILEHGSLLVMRGETQLHWLHRLPPTTKVKRPRINLTFRTILQ
jgi:alkylated DNA repair dioxygenase AlkB